MEVFVLRAMNDRVAYIIYCIDKFADHYHLSPRQAHAYLQRYQGLAFLNECYEAEHQLSFENALDDLTMICKRNGGGLE